MKNRYFIGAIVVLFGLIALSPLFVRAENLTEGPVGGNGGSENGNEGAISSPGGTTQGNEGNTNTSGGTQNGSEGNVNGSGNTDNGNEGNTNTNGGTTNTNEGNTNTNGGTTNNNEGNTNTSGGTTNTNEGNTNVSGGSENGNELAGGNTNPPNNPPNNPPSNGGGGFSGANPYGPTTPAATTTATTTGAATTTSVLAPVATSTLPVIAPNICQPITAPLRAGSTDKDQVSKLQQLLNKFNNASLIVNGIFDQTTVTAVENFQAKYQSDILAPWGASQPSGYVYITTLKKLNELNCNLFRSLDANELAVINAFRARAQAQTVSPSSSIITPASTEVGSAPVIIPAVASVANTNTNGSQSQVANAFTAATQAFGNFFKRLFNR